MLKEKIDDGIIKTNVSGLPTETNHIDYGLGRNALLVKVYRRTIMKWLNLKLHGSILLKEPDIIFDCCFDGMMTRVEQKNTAKQLKYAFSENRTSRRPFVMHLCNIKYQSQFYRDLLNEIPNIEKTPLRLHEQDITEIIDTKRLVYLTPDSENVLHTFDSKDCYVVGGVVDKGQQKPLTLAKAKSLEIRTARFPIDKYVRFRSHKSLTLDQVMKILVTIKQTENWKEAMKHIPSRKIH